MAKAKKVESWGSIPKQVFKDFEKRVEKLWEEMIPQDYDDSSPIEVMVINRMTHSLHARPVPRNEIYDYENRGYKKLPPEEQKELDEETEKWLIYNIQASANALDLHWKLKQFRDRDKSKLGSPKAKTKS